MNNFIIVVVLAIILFFAIRSSLKHFHGEGGCCGGSTYKAREKKLDNVVEKRTFSVEGMSCQNCVNRVMEAVNSIDGLSGVVNLKKGLVTVSMDHPVDNDIIKRAIEKAGYQVIEVKVS